MKKIEFVDPEKKDALRLSVQKNVDVYESSAGAVYPVKEGIPDLIYPRQLNEEDEKVQHFYDGRAGAYEDCLYLTFKTHDVDEIVCRNGFIDALELTPESKILEIASGTGRDSVLIADRLSNEGELHLTDISSDMLKICKGKFEKSSLPVCFSQANASYLPYPDQCFDAVYSFGALGEFTDIKACLDEMVRVTKKGGKIVIGDESMPPWLRGSYFDRVLTKTNPQFAAPIPWEEIPVAARDLRLQYVINNVFYLIDFRVGEGEPVADFDFDIPGVRGGTYRTRLEGELEGVSKEAKDMAYRFIKKKGISMHDWLDKIVRKAVSESSDAK